MVYESLRTFIAKKNLEINKKKALEKHFGLWTEHGHDMYAVYSIQHNFQILDLFRSSLQSDSIHSVAYRFCDIHHSHLHLDGPVLHDQLIEEKQL